MRNDAALDEVVSRIPLDDNPEDAPDTELKAALERLVREEVERLKTQNVHALHLPLKNCGLVRRSDGDCFNRVEVSSGYDFDKVVQLLISPAQAIANRKGWEMCVVICLTKSLRDIVQGERLVCIAIPYVHRRERSNSLRYWRFVNSQLTYSDHEVDALQTVG
eukprot:ANDGO_06633.mRNA.1 hypothetical protein AURANDRAFT_35198